MKPRQPLLLLPPQKLSPLLAPVLSLLIQKHRPMPASPLPSRGNAKKTAATKSSLRLVLTVLASTSSPPTSTSHAFSGARQLPQTAQASTTRRPPSPALKFITSPHRPALPAPNQSINSATSWPKTKGPKAEDLKSRCLKPLCLLQTPPLIFPLLLVSLRVPPHL